MDIFQNDKSIQHYRMKTIEEIRRENARLLAKTVANAADFAERIDASESRVSQLIGVNPTKNIGRVTARRIEQAFNRPAGWLDAAHSNLESVETVSVPSEKITAQESAANDEVNLDEVMEWISILRNAPRKERDAILTILKVATRRVSHKSREAGDK